MAKSKKSLTETHPELTREWHPIKNSLLPWQVSAGSNKKVWWKCDKGPDHEWEAQPNSRTGQGQGCPICSNKKIVLSNSLATTHTELSQQWHPSKNYELTPRDVGAGSNKRVWWKCDKGPDHEWNTKPADRVNYNTGCPICSNKKIVLSNSLATTHPELSQQWHPSKNYELTPRDVGAGSNKRVWWKCDKGPDHEWRTSIEKRSNRSQGCPYCAGRKLSVTNSLESAYPDLTKEWNYHKNSDITPDMVYKGSYMKVWWQCPKDANHSYQMSVSDRQRGYNCPICRGLMVVRSNSLAHTHEHLLVEWDYERNSENPNEITANSNKKVYWRCNAASDHIWLVSPNSRVSQNSGCPYCASRMVTKSNCLSTTHPRLGEELHPTKNGNLTPDNIAAFYSKRVWWKCKIDENHQWFVKPVDRANYNTGCPYCTLTPQSKQELIITFELKTLFNRINPKGFKTQLDGRLRAIDIFIPQLNLCMEFDGSYWHKGKREIDKIKSNLLLKEGYSVIRIREEPLKKIHDTDVISKQPYDGKQVTNDILSKILSMYELDSDLVNRIKEYQSKGELQNEKGLNRYIDKTLKEKAEKK